MISAISFTLTQQISILAFDLWVNYVGIWLIPSGYRLNFWKLTSESTYNQLKVQSKSGLMMTEM